MERHQERNTFEAIEKYTELRKNRHESGTSTQNRQPKRCDIPSMREIDGFGFRWFFRCFPFICLRIAHTYVREFDEMHTNT